MRWAILRQCATAIDGYRAGIGEEEKTPDQKIGDAEREADHDLSELEREGDRMEERLDEAAGDEAGDDEAAGPAETSEPGVDETDAPEDEGESAEQAGQ